MTTLPTAHDILNFWFGDISLDDATILKERSKWWFVASDETDTDIRERFTATLEAAERGELDSWMDKPEGRLALIIVLDQFSRVIYRGSGKSFQNDARALEIAQDGMRTGVDVSLRPALQVFYLMPFMHSEDLEIQEDCVALFKALFTAYKNTPLGEALQGNHEYAIRHRDVIAKFGRYPHRNAWLGRDNTPEEQEFLDAGNTF